MIWQKQLKEYENNKDWGEAVELMNDIILNKPDDQWVYIETICLFHNILVEENYPEEKQDNLVYLLKKIF